MYSESKSESEGYLEGERHRVWQWLCDASGSRESEKYSAVDLRFLLSYYRHYWFKFKLAESRI